jgi:hypothetical protein
VAILGARRLLRMTYAAMRRYQGRSGPVPRLRNIPLTGVEPGRPLSDLLAEPAQRLLDDEQLPAGEADSGQGRSAS